VERPLVVRANPDLGAVVGEHRVRHDTKYFLPLFGALSIPGCVSLAAVGQGSRGLTDPVGLTMLAVLWAPIPVVLGWMLVGWSDRLVIHRRGFAYSRLGRMSVCRWQDVARYRVGEGRAGQATLIGVELTGGTMMHFHYGMTGLDDLLAGYLENTPPERRDRMPTVSPKVVTLHRVAGIAKIVTLLIGLIGTAVLLLTAVVLAFTA
jgi:hypothetical protein